PTALALSLSPSGHSAPITPSTLSLHDALPILDIGRVEILARTRMLRRVLKRGWRPIVGSTFIRYKKSLLPFERFTIRSRIVCWDEKWLYFEHVLERRGEVAAQAYVRGVLRGKSGNVKPRELLELAGTPSLESPEMPAAVAAWKAILDAGRGAVHAEARRTSLRKRRRKRGMTRDQSQRLAHQRRVLRLVQPRR